MDAEDVRIQFLLRRDGAAETRRWIERTLEIYRSALTNPGNHAALPEYRARFERAVAAYERYLAGATPADAEQAMTDREHDPMRIERAFIDPGSVFRSPREVLACGHLSREQKIELLRRWEYDVRELQVAEEENMPGRMPVGLDEILQALRELGAGSAAERSSPTKQGGA